MLCRVMYLPFVVISLLAFIFGCGPKPKEKIELFSGSQYYYSEGLHRLESADLNGALADFEKAQSLDPDFPGSYVGIAMVKMEMGDFESALQMVKKAKQKDSSFAEAYIVNGRILTRRMTGDWIKEAIEEFDAALGLSPNSDAAYFYKAEAYKTAYMFAEAAEAYSRVSRLNGRFAHLAGEQLEIMHRLSKIAPQTLTGKRIALADRITRADLTALLYEELGLRRKVENSPLAYKSDPPPVYISDILSHPARKWIEDIARLRLIGLEVYPDGTFKPDEPVRRLDFALVVQGILSLFSDDPGLTTRYFGEQSRFRDVPSDHYAYNAMALCVVRGIMNPDRSGNFRPLDNISGLEVLTGITGLRRELKLE
nr:hypothetical protein [Desulfobacterales bacterium]